MERSPYCERFAVSIVHDKDQIVHYDGRITAHDTGPHYIGPIDDIRYGTTIDRNALHAHVILNKTSQEGEYIVAHHDECPVPVHKDKGEFFGLQYLHLTV